MKAAYSLYRGLVVLLAIAGALLYPSAAVAQQWSAQGADSYFVGEPPEPPEPPEPSKPPKPPEPAEPPPPPTDPAAAPPPPPATLPQMIDSHY